MVLIYGSMLNYSAVKANVENNNDVGMNEPPTIPSFTNTCFENHQISLNDYECSGEDSGCVCAREGSGEDYEGPNEIICSHDCFELDCEAEGNPPPHIE